MMNSRGPGNSLACDLDSFSGPAAHSIPAVLLTVFSNLLDLASVQIQASKVDFFIQFVYYQDKNKIKSTVLSLTH